MTTKRSVENELDDLSERILGDLEPAKRLRLSLRAQAEGDEKTHERLVETTPMLDYKITDPEFAENANKLSKLSFTASYELQLQYTKVRSLKAERDRQVALMLLNEALGRLARGDFGVDEYGDMDVGDHSEGDYDYGMKQSPDVASLATKYRRLWDDLPFELEMGEDERDTDYFPGLAAGGLMGYPQDLSAPHFDDIEEDRISSDAHRSDVRLMLEVVDFYTYFHGWRLFAEDHIGVSLDEFLDAMRDESATVGSTVGSITLDEETCQNILSVHEDYLDAFPRAVAETVDSEEDADVDIDLRAQRFAESTAEIAELPFEE